MNIKQLDLAVQVIQVRTDRYTDSLTNLSTITGKLDQYEDTNTIDVILSGLHQARQQAFADNNDCVQRQFDLSTERPYIGKQSPQWVFLAGDLKKGLQACLDAIKEHITQNDILTTKLRNRRMELAA